jgi:hypothetical protein
MIVQFILMMIVLFVSMLGGQAAIRAYPELFLHLFVPAAFALTTWYAVCLFRDEFKSYFHIAVHLFITAYLGWCFYIGLVGLDRHLAGVPVFKTQPTSWLDILLGIIVGLLIGSGIIGLRVLYEKYERRKERKMRMARIDPCDPNYFV